jgi:V/A-type H+-transporting ATPase subunit K
MKGYKFVLDKNHELTVDLFGRIKRLSRQPRNFSLLILSFNLAVFVVALMLLRPGIVIAQGTSSSNQTSVTPTPARAQPESLMAAAVALAGAAIGSGVAVYGAASAGAAAIAERPSAATWVIILAGLGEGIAIYGLIIAIVIIGKA